MPSWPLPSIMTLTALATPGILREIRDPDATVLVARVARDRIGFAAMRFDFDRSSAHLLLLAVAPQHRRRGVGRALLAWLEVVARRGGIERIALEVRETASEARAFYRREGFRAVLIVNQVETREHHRVGPALAARCREPYWRDNCGLVVTIRKLDAALTRPSPRMAAPSCSGAPGAKIVIRRS